MKSFAAVLLFAASCSAAPQVLCAILYTDKKENKIFLIYKEIQKEAVASHIWLTASSYMTEYLLIASHIRKQPLLSEIPHMWRKFYFLFCQCRTHLIEIRCRNFCVFCFAIPRSDGSWTCKRYCRLCIDLAPPLYSFIKEKLLDGKAGLDSLVFSKVKHNNPNKCFDSFSFVSYIDTILAEYALGE